MATTKTASRAEVEHQVAAIDAGQRIAGEEPTAEDLDAARRVLAGELTAEQAIQDGLAELEARVNHTR